MKKQEDTFYEEAALAWQEKKYKGLRVRCMIDCDAEKSKAKKMFLMEFVSRKQKEFKNEEKFFTSERRNLNELERELNEREITLNNLREHLESLESGISRTRK